MEVFPANIYHSTLPIKKSSSTILFDKVVDKFNDEINSSNAQIVENIINECRLLELIMAVEKIKEEDFVIIQGQVRFKSQTVRGSKYRGVSKNGNKWQVLVMGNQKK